MPQNNSCRIGIFYEFAEKCPCESLCHSCGADYTAAMLFDLHVHSAISPCSRLPLGDILAHARARGLDGVCVTDHDTMDARRALEEGVQPDGLCVVIGMEYATPQGDFLLFGPFEELEPGLHAARLLPLVHASGGAVVAAHPFRAGRSTDEAIVKSGLCRAVERINGRNSRVQNGLVDNWLARYPLFACGGSDAHSLDELGRVATRFNVPVRSRADLVGALRQGLCSPVRLRPRQDMTSSASVPLSATS